ncbi:ATP-binding protein [Deinococcus sp.]|uniref:AAA family ATPase n=1 Tax=Deinococcus sp. TaxID=47478 RepID=UPI0025D55AD6|nr:ATP-binding protein [Deinococcus sp.]
MSDVQNTNHRPVVILLCGMTGSGKSTLAKRLESEFLFVRFSIDEWMISLFGHHMSRKEFDDRMANTKTRIFDIVSQLVKLNVNIVLDYGFWRQEERALVSKMIKDINGYPVIYYLDVDAEILRERLTVRNSTRIEGEFEVTEEMLKVFLKGFSVPSDEEAVEIIHLSGPSLNNDVLAKHIMRLSK